MSAPPRHLLRPRHAAAAGALLLLLVPAGEAGGQEPSEWNTGRVLDLVKRGRAERHRTMADSGLTGYEARARGHLYFLVDRPDAEERTLVRADQLALEIHWKAPGLTRQRIVGRRNEKRLPTNIKYHLDHLTVVTDDFDDRIELGDGDEIRSVLHPLAPRSEAVYDFRLADSLTISFPGPREAVRVYEVEVQPREMERPGYVGSIFLDRKTAGIVRMSFTFTPSSYVDPYLDYIRISLDNGLWEGRYWLPYRQEVEIRRELPQLDFPAGSVIQGRWEIGRYRLDPDMPAEFFRGPRVTSVPEEEAERFPFEVGLYEEADREGLAPTPSLERIRSEAMRMAGSRYLSGLRRLRLFLPSASALARYNRAEGLFVGSGFSYRPAGSLAVRVNGGWSFGREQPQATVKVTGGETRPGTGVRVTWNDLRDVGSLLGASGVVNSVAALALATDYLDPYFATGATAFHTVSPRPGVELELRARVEEFESGRNVVTEAGGSDSLRRVRPVEEGRETAGELVARLGPSGVGLSARLLLTGATLEEESYGAARGRLSWNRSWLSSEVELTADLHGGAVTSGAPVQRLFLLGGRGTLSGYSYRAWVGDRFWLLRVGASWGVASPWLRARAFGSAGSTALKDHTLPPGWRGRPTPITLFSAGVGVGLLWDVVHVDLARGLNGGQWAWNVFVNHRFWPWL